MITKEEVLMGRDLEYPLDTAMQDNLDRLLVALNILRLHYGKPMIVSSGYRPGHYNTDAGGAKHSNHMVCMACDFHDPDGALDAWCLLNGPVLEQAGLYQESPAHTHGWCHLQINPPASGHRVFIP